MIEFLFDSNGYLILTDEPVLADRTSVEYHFGSSSVLRWDLWNSVEKLLEMLSVYSVPVVKVWLDGSFISQKPDPNDVDIVIFISYWTFRNSREMLDKLSDSFIYLDVKWIPISDMTDDLSLAIDALERMKWFVLFSSDRNGLPKGFINLKIN